MKSPLLPILAALGLSAGAVVPLAPADQAQAQRTRGPSWATRTYVMKAGAGDLYEIQSSELALRRSRRADVRETAEMMIRDHRGTTATVTEAARRDGVPVRPPMLEAAQRTMMRQLERASGPAFDRLYLTQQMTAHSQALALHRSYARTGDARALRQAAASAVPVVQGHIAHLRRLRR